MTWKHLGIVICTVCLVATLPHSPARAGSNGGAVAAGLVGAVAGAIILNQMMQGSRQGAYRHRSSHVSKPKGKPSTDTANSKDPFATQSAPAGYATPVSTK